MGIKSKCVGNSLVSVITGVPGGFGEHEPMLHGGSQKPYFGAIVLSEGGHTTIRVCKNCGCIYAVDED